MQNTLYQRLRKATDGDHFPVRVKQTGKPFTIAVRAVGGLRGYGVIPDGQTRVKGGHLTLDPQRLQAWADELDG